MIPSGRRRHVLTVMNPGALVPDGSGGYTETPVVLAQSIFGELVPAMAQERRLPNLVTASASHVVTIPYLAGVSMTSTIIFHDAGVDRKFAIAGIVDPEERHVELVLACEEAK